MMEQESGRCRRTDGKKWRCSKEALAEQKYCENHIHRGRKRSRKHSEAALDFKSSTTSTKHPINVTDTKLSESLSNPPLATINTLVNNVKKNANNDMDRRKEDNNVQSLFTTSGQIFRLDVNNNDDKRKRSENGYGEWKSSDRCNIIRNKFNLESMNKGDKSNAHVAPLVTGFPLRSNHHVGGTSMTGNTLLAEERRCRRTDGKKWRCSREVVANQKYCVSHMHRGAKRYAGTGLRANMFAPHHHAVAGIEVEEEDEVNTRLCISPAMNLGLFRRRGSSPSHSNGSSSDATTITDENGCVCP